MKKKLLQLFILRLFAPISISLLISMFPAISKSQSLSDKSLNENIESYLNELEKVGFNGSILIEKEGKIILSKGYGYADLENQIKNTAQTIFDIGSLTKQFTATAILKLEQDGKLSTEDRISNFFEDIPLEKSSIRIHDLLRHQSGLVSNVGSDYENIPKEDFLKRVFESKLIFEPGTEFSYSNIGYSLLAMIIEKTSGQDYEDYLYENLWEPAQMELTGYSRPLFLKNNVAIGYQNNSKPWGRPTEKDWNRKAPFWQLKGNGGILSCTEDLYKWHLCMHSNKILSDDSKKKLYYPGLRLGENKEAFYAYGWDVSKTSRNTTRIWHNGTNRIFYADFLSFPEDSLTSILLINKSHQNFNDANFEIARIVFNPDYEPEIPAEENEVNLNFTLRIINTIIESGLADAKVIYDHKEKSENLLEFKMRSSGFDHLDEGYPGQAIDIFEMNVYAHPHSAKALQGLAEGYMETGKTELAIKYFQESLSINSDNPFIFEMLKRINETKN